MGFYVYLVDMRAIADFSGLGDRPLNVVYMRAAFLRFGVAEVLGLAAVLRDFLAGFTSSLAGGSR